MYRKENYFIKSNSVFAYHLDNYDNDDDDNDTNMTNNTIVQDHRNLFEWSEARNSSGLPIDMVFNDGHLLSIIVYR